MKGIGTSKIFGDATENSLTFTARKVKAHEFAKLDLVKKVDQT